jgi:hypothetical protein
MTQPPYGAPQGVPPQPPPYLGGAPAPQQHQQFQQPYPPQNGYGGVALPPPPPSAKRTIGFTMGLITAIALIGFVVLVAIITATN